MDVKIKALHKKERDNMHLERLKVKSEDACARLNNDILGIKQQKVMHKRAYLQPGFVCLVNFSDAYSTYKCSLTSVTHSDYLEMCYHVRSFGCCGMQDVQSKFCLRCAGYLDETDREVQQGFPRLAEGTRERSTSAQAPGMQLSVHSNWLAQAVTNSTFLHVLPPCW